MKKENGTDAELLFGETIYEPEETSRKPAPVRKKVARNQEKKITPFKRTFARKSGTEDKKVKNGLGNGLKIIPLGGLEQIGMNITAFEYEIVKRYRFFQFICSHLPSPRSNDKIPPPLTNTAPPFHLYRIRSRIHPLSEPTLPRTISCQC